MPYLQFQELFSDIGKAWDLEVKNQPASQQAICNIKHKFSISSGLTARKEKKEVIEELIDVSLQLMQPREETNGLSDCEELECKITNSISKKRLLKRSNSLESLSNCCTNVLTLYIAISAKRQCETKEVTWQDIIGQEDAKRGLYESCILSSLLPSSVFVGCRQLCTTILLYGPPGTGKTTLVHAVANESRFLVYFDSL